MSSAIEPDDREWNIMAPGKLSKSYDNKANERDLVIFEIVSGCAVIWLGSDNLMALKRPDTVALSI